MNMSMLCLLLLAIAVVELNGVKKSITQHTTVKIRNIHTLEVGHWDWSTFEWMAKHQLKIETHGAEYLMNRETQKRDCS